MPAQHGVRHRDGREVTTLGTTESVRSGRQAAAIVIREAPPRCAELTAQTPVLFDEVRDGLALTPREPAGQDQPDQTEDRRVDHEPERISSTRRKDVG
jgi:hypothetical protein